MLTMCTPPHHRQIPQTAGKAALAMEAFTRALRQLPTIIADNAGLDSSELVTQVCVQMCCWLFCCCFC